MAKSTVSLRVFGDDLDPDEISRLLGAVPDASYRKGEPISPARPEHSRKFGMWSLKATDAESEAYDEQTQRLLSRVSRDLAIWALLGTRYQVDLFCGFFMDTTNQGFSLSAATLLSLAERGISPGFDIYAPSPEEEAEYLAEQEPK